MPQRQLLAQVSVIVLLLVLPQTAATAQECPPPETRTRPLTVVSVDAALSSVARCTSADLEAGRWMAAERRLAAAAATRLAPAAGARLGEWRALLARLHAIRRLDESDWPVLAHAAVPLEEALPWVGPLVRGMAAARASWARQDAALQASAREELHRLSALAAAAGPLSESEWARLVVQGAMAGAQYEREEMQLLLDSAHDLEQRLLAGDDLRPPVVRARELEADLLRITDRYAAAAERYQAILLEAPRRVHARVGLADAYRRLGRAREAEDALAEARALWAGADPAALALLR